MNTLILARRASLACSFGLLLSTTATGAAQAISYDSSEDASVATHGKPRNSYERQREEYRQHNYDSYRNGPLQETLEQQRREERRQEEYRRDNAERQRSDSYGNSSGYYGGGDTYGNTRPR